MAELDGQRVAVAGFGPAALSCAARHRLIGWSREQQYARRIHIAGTCSGGRGRPRADLCYDGIGTDEAGKLPVVDSQMALCPVSEADLALLQRLYSDPLVSGEHEWHGWQDTRWLRREWEENGLLGEDRGTLMARKGDDTVGFVAWRRRSYGPHSPCWIISIGLKPEARGHGHGTEAQRQLTRYLFAHTPANRIEAGTEITNVGEQRALERAGFTREGVLRGALFRQGQWHDCVFYGVLRHEVDLDSEAAGATGRPSTT